MGVRYPGRKPTVTTNPLEMIFDVFMNLVRALVQAVMGKFIPGGGSGIPGLPAGVNPLAFLSDLLEMRWAQVDDIEDGQYALRDRMELMEDVSGYCNLYQNGDLYVSNNWGSSNARPVPWALNNPVGPFKNASPYTHNIPGMGNVTGIRFDSYGTWQIDTELLTPGSFTIGGSTRVFIAIYVIDMQTNSIYTQKVYYNEAPAFHRSHQLGHKVIIPEGNRYFACVGVRASRSGSDVRYVGGDTYTSFSVDRMDIRTDGALNPPSQGELPDP